MSIRDDVAKAICDDPQSPCLCKDGSGWKCRPDVYQSQLGAADRATAAFRLSLVAAGYRIVPVEASWEMLGEGAGAATAVPSEDGLIREPEVRAAWQAMIAAAPPIDVESEKP